MIQKNKQNRAIERALSDILFTADCLEGHAKDMKMKGKWHWVNNSVGELRKNVAEIKRLLNVK